MTRTLFLLAVLPLQLFCQTDTLPKNADGKYEYTGVVNVDSASADKLYSNAKLFIADNFKSGKDVTQLNDDYSKTVIGRGIEHSVKFKITIQCKEGKYRYVVEDFEYIYEGVNNGIPLEDEKRLKHYMTKNMHGAALERTSLDTKTLITNLKKHMASQSMLTQDF